MSFNYSNSNIIDDYVADTRKLDYEYTRMSEVPNKISDDFNRRKVKSILELNLSDNMCSAANSILQYCFDNKDGFFSIDDFEYLDLSQTWITSYNEEEENLATLACNLLNKYPNLTINMSYTLCDYPVWRDKCIEINPYKDTNIKSRLILERTTTWDIRYREYRNRGGKSLF